MSNLLNRVRRLELAQHEGGGRTYGFVVRDGSPENILRVLEQIADVRRRDPEAWIYVANLAGSPDLRAQGR